MIVHRIAVVCDICQSEHLLGKWESHAQLWIERHRWLQHDGMDICPHCAEYEEQDNDTDTQPPTS